MIPKVKTYRVTWWKGLTPLAHTHVQAPTKYLARCAVCDEIRTNHALLKAWETADRVTYYVERAPKETPNQAKDRQRREWGYIKENEI